MQVALPQQSIQQHQPPTHRGSASGLLGAPSPSDPPLVHITLTGHRLRYFTALLSTVVRMCESVHLEPMQDALLVRAVAPTRTTHLLAVLDSKASFDRFLIHAPWEHADGTPLPDTASVLPPTLKLIGKSIAMTALRHGSSTQSLEIRYDASVSQDHVQLIITSQTGLIRNYQLNLQESSNEKAHVDNRFYRFECVADPKTWGSYINSLCPSSGTSQGKLAILPMSSRLVLRAYGASADGTDMFGDHHQSSSSSSNAVTTSRAAFGSMVSVEQNQFLFYSYPSASTGGSIANTQQQQGRDSGSGGGGLFNNGPSVCTLPSQPAAQQPQHATTISLPGKSIELKPMRQFLRVCEALGGLKTRLMTGVDGIPVFLEGVAKEGEPPVRHISLLVAALDSNEGMQPSSTSTNNNNNNNVSATKAAEVEGGGSRTSGVVGGSAGRNSRLSSSCVAAHDPQSTDTTSRGNAAPPPPSQHHQHQQPPILRDETQQHHVVPAVTMMQPHQHQPMLPPATGSNSLQHNQPSVVVASSSSLPSMQRRNSSISRAPSSSSNIIGADSTIICSIGPQEDGNSSPSVAPRNPQQHQQHPQQHYPQEAAARQQQQQQHDVKSILRKSGGGAGGGVSAQQHQRRTSPPPRDASETLPHIAIEKANYYLPSTSTSTSTSSSALVPSSLAGASSVLAYPTPHHHRQQHQDDGTSSYARASTSVSVSHVPASSVYSSQGGGGGCPSDILDGDVEGPPLPSQGDYVPSSTFSRCASSVLAPPSSTVLSTSFSQSAATRRRQQQRLNNNGGSSTSQVGSSQYPPSGGEFVPSSQHNVRTSQNTNKSPDLRNVLSSPVRRDDGAVEVPSPVREPHYYPNNQHRGGGAAAPHHRQVPSSSSTPPNHHTPSSSATSIPSSGNVGGSGGGVVGRLHYGDTSSAEMMGGAPRTVSGTPEGVPSSHPQQQQHHNHWDTHPRPGEKRSREEVVVEDTPPPPRHAAAVVGGQGWSTPMHVGGGGGTSTSPVIYGHRSPIDNRTTGRHNGSGSPSFVPGTEERLRLQPTPLAVSRGTAPPTAAPPPHSQHTSGSGTAPSLTPAQISAYYSQFVIASSSDDDNDA